MRDATNSRRVRSSNSRHFNPRVPCGTRHYWARPHQYYLYFNPRVPCGTRLYLHVHYSMGAPYFNPRVPCGTRRVQDGRGYWFKKFQSTRPMRDATPNSVAIYLSLLFQSTRPMRDATCTARS